MQWGTCSGLAKCTDDNQAKDPCGTLHPKNLEYFGEHLAVIWVVLANLEAHRFSCPSLNQLQNANEA